MLLEEKQLKALSEGDSKAFDQLFLNYHPKLVHFLFGFLKSEELARDIAQDIFFMVWINRGKFAQIRSFKSYLFKMAKNAICNYYDHSLVIEKYEMEQFLSIPLADNSLEETVFVNELQSLIDIIVDQMSPQRKKIYRMSRVEGLANSEIAEQLQLNKRTVENHLSGALSEIREALKKAIVLFL